LHVRLYQCFGVLPQVYLGYANALAVLTDASQHEA
jgi:hypothetical protein